MNVTMYTLVSVIGTSTHQVQAIDVPFVLIKVLQHIPVLHPPGYHTARK